jgi:nucleotide-binding universal stress UspA family protein
MQFKISRILFPTDFIEPAKQALQYAMEFADRFDAELHLLHIIPEVVYPIPDVSTAWALPVTDQQPEIDAATKRLQDEIGSEWSGRHRVVRMAEVGYPSESIVDYAKQHKIDLIVIGTHGHTGLSHLLLGSVAEKVVRLASCPVLTVHPTGHQFVINSPMTRSASAVK